MKKILLSIPFILGGAWAGTSYFAGQKAQSAYDDALTKQHVNAPFILEKESYSAGLANSIAITKVMDSATGGDNVMFRVQHKIAHSPIGLTDGSISFGTAQIKSTILQDDSLGENAKHVLAGFGSEVPFVANTVVKLDGSSSTQIVMSKYQYDLEDDKGQIKFSGFDYTVEAMGENMRGKGDIGEFSAQGGEGSINSSPVKLDFDLTRLASGLYTGSSTLLVDSISMSGKQLPPMQLGSVGSTFVGNIEDDDVSNSVKMYVEEIDAGIPLNSALLSMSTDEISVSAWEAFSNASRAVSTIGQPDEVDPEALSEYIKTAFGLLEPDVNFQFGLDLANDGGKADADLKLQVVEESSPNFPAGGISAAETLGDILKALTLDIAVDADAAAINQTPLAMFLNHPMAQQFIVVDGTQYKVKINVADLVADINGQPLDLQFMIPVSSFYPQ